MKPDSPGSPGDAVLYGQDPMTHIVSVEPDPEIGAWVYRRLEGRVQAARVPYRPWILLTEYPETPLQGAELTRLEGEGYRILAEFVSPAAFQSARFRLRDEHREHLTYPGGARMPLLRSGRTLFKGMAFENLVRLQFDIETSGLNPEHPECRLLLIAVSDSCGLLQLLEGDEPEILAQFVALVSERDPDVLEGHNIFGFDLPFLLRRAERHGVRLPLGRDGSEPRVGQERNYAIGGNSRPFTPVYLYGRHLVDTYLVVQRFDWARGALSSYGLKECARVFGFAAQDRVELPRDRIAELYARDPDLVREYARQDVVETRLLADLITPVEFYQTQMTPDNYGQVVTCGNGEKINAILMRAYLAAGIAIPRQQPPRPYAGAYTDVRKTGVLDRVVKADVESLYPSLMLTHQISPRSDTLQIFLPALRELTRRRLEAKRKAAEGAGFHYWDGLQNSFKVLINSFYGYVGGPFHWNDYEAAERVTELGRELVQEVSGRITAAGGEVIEVDTDGVYFTPPVEIADEEAEREFVARAGSFLPEGIRLAFDGRYAAMLSLKTKNYVLVTYSGRRVYKGASLRSRADERYGRRFLTQAVDCLLAHDPGAVAALYAQTLDDLFRRRIPIEDLVRRERVTDKTFHSGLKRRAAAVARNVPVGEYVLVYEKEDGSLGLLADYAGDENVRYYMDKLYKFARRLREAFDGAFDRLIPKPTAQGMPQAIQTSLDLF